MGYEPLEGLVPLEVVFGPEPAGRFGAPALGVSDPPPEPLPSVESDPPPAPATDAKPVAKTASPQVRVVTNMGSFTIELNSERAPLTVMHFLTYVDAGFYTNTLFHRVVSNFVVQGGGFDTDYKPKNASIKVFNESGNGLSNVRGAVGMARTSDPHAANAQFYVNLNDNPALDPNPSRWGYAVFGRVTDGMEVIDRIAAVSTGRRKGYDDAPLEDVLISSARRHSAS